MLLRSVYRVAIAIVAGAMLYSLVGFLFAPLLLKHQLESSQPRTSSSRVTIERVAVNPYTFRIDLFGTRLESTDGRYVVNLSRLEARLDVVSVLKRDPVITAVTIGGADVRVTLDPAKSESTHFSATLAFLMNGARALAPGRIERLTLSGSRLRVDASARSDDATGPSSANGGADFDLEILDLDPTEPSQARFTVSATLPRSATLAGKGTVDVIGQDVRLTGDFELEYAEIEDRSSDKLVFRAPHVAAEGVEIDSSTEATQVERLRLERPELRVARLRSGRIELPGWLMRLVTGSESAIATVERIEIADGSAILLDQAVSPKVVAHLETIVGVIRPGASAPPAYPSGGGPQREEGGKDRSIPNVQLEGRLMGSGIDRLVASWRRTDGLALGQVDLELTDVDLALLSPYFRAATGRGLEAGRIDLGLRVDRSDYGARSQARVSIRGLVLGECDAGFSQSRWPLQRAVALLEDSNGRIELGLAARAKETSGDDLRLAGLGSALGRQLRELSARPFEALATLAGVPGQPLERVLFEPGSAELSATMRMRLDALSRALVARPAVALTVQPAYDPRSDRDALAEQQMRLHIALATSAGPPGRARAAPLDFDDGKVRVVLDEFAAERLSAATLEAVSGRFSLADRAYYQAIFDRLVANEAVSASALERLGSFRARSIVNELTAAGVAETQLVRADAIEPINGQSGVVSLPLGLSIPSTDSVDCRP